ncbi:hypothetical protein ACGFU4_35900 [Streptomyces sp. NPDC048511]|uniref:hypothetical protein n=1 Tax=Streptomyces sp. NPDC048511 TaxID=3365562 RepID=UPI0037244E4E
MPDTQPIPSDGEQQPAADSSTPPMPATPPAAAPTAAPTAGQAPARRSRLRTLTTLLIGAMAGAAIVGGTWYATNSHTDSSDQATTGLPADVINTKPDGTFDLTGEFTLTEGVISDSIGGCEGDGGYGDIGIGTSVTVYDAAGSVIATSALFISTYDEAAGSCTYDVSVEDVPAGEDFYQVEISHRGKIQLSAEEAQSGAFAGSLGD